MMKTNKHLRFLAILVIALLAVSSLSSTSVEAAASKLKVGYYSGTKCSNVEAIVRNEVAKKAKQDETIIPALLRIYFHDCFANKQCDASLLLKSMPKNVKTELDNGSNLGVNHLDFIDYLKRRVLAACKNVNIVSCADIIALATRDAVALASKRPPYPVPTGRLDGRESLMASADFLPGSRTSIATIVQRFGDVSITPEETVVLSGAHTIGQAKCRFFNDRIHDFFNTKKPDRTMDPALVNELKKTCPSMQTNLNSAVFLDQGYNSKKVLDKSYFVQLTKSRGVLQSDQNLHVSTVTKKFVTALAAGSEDNFYKKFEAAMIKLGNLGATAGYKGEIRTVCSVLNS